MYKKIYKIVVSEDIKNMTVCRKSNNLYIGDGSVLKFSHKNIINSLNKLITFVEFSYKEITKDFNDFQSYENICVVTKYIKKSKKIEVALFLPDNNSKVTNAIFIGNMKNSFCKSCNKDIYKNLFNK